MKNLAYVHANLVFLLTMLFASAVTMVWLFWRFPLATAIATVAVLAAVMISARLARSSDSDGVPDLKPRQNGLGSQ